jgi:L-ascorbate metabolism protein UlaG (beta-lactamase superfamily)
MEHINLIMEHGMKTILNSIAASTLLLVVNDLAWSADTTTLIWHGHAAFEIHTPKNKVLLIDPWLKNPVNPNAKDGKDPLAAIAKADYILITHAHSDHIGDSVELAKKTGARLVTSGDLGKNMVKLLGYPKEQMGRDTLFNIGGVISIADGEVAVNMVPAVHSSGMGNPLAGEKEADVAYGGNPAGYVIKIKNGPTIYHTGDTAYFSDMALIGEHAPDVALINIGGHFGMEPPMAGGGEKAVLTPDSDCFAEALGKMRIPVKIMQPGSSLVFKGKEVAAN